MIIQTKWDLIDADERRALANTPCHHVACAGCDITLFTEADFAKHFIVPDARYLNIGHCPKSVLLGEPSTRAVYA